VSFFGEGHNREALEDMAKLLGVSSVRFRGFTENIIDIWREHHALLLASRAEGLPLVLVEAMLCGRPGIVTTAGGCAEVVEDGKTGFIAKVADYHALDAAMERAWSCRERWRQMGLDASRSIRSHVPPDPCAVFAAKLEEICSAVMNER
jgi:glycosyltransferase involved in cell wall biosynthesis